MQRKALVVDDSAVVRHRLSTILRELGFSVVEAENGKVALSVLAENGDATLALVDWNMPEMDGVAFIEAVRTIAAHAGLRIMMVTTMTDHAFVARALSAGADEYMMKPFDCDMVVEKLKILGIES